MRWSPLKPKNVRQIRTCRFCREAFVYFRDGPFDQHETRSHGKASEKYDRAPRGGLLVIDERRAIAGNLVVPWQETPDEFASTPELEVYDALRGAWLDEELRAGRGAWNDDPTATACFADASEWMLAAKAFFHGWWLMASLVAEPIPRRKGYRTANQRQPYPVAPYPGESSIGKKVGERPSGNRAQTPVFRPNDAG